MSEHLAGDEAGPGMQTEHLERDVQQGIVDFVGKLLRVGLPVYVVFVVIEVVSGNASAMVWIQCVVVIAMSATIWGSSSLRVRGTALVFGMTALGIAALFHFGPMLGTGLFYLVASLLSSFLGSRTQTVVVVGLLSASIAMPPLLDIGPEQVVLDDVTWLRITLATTFPLVVAGFLFRRIRESVLSSLQATKAAAEHAGALEEERRQLFVAAMQTQRLESLGRLSGEVAHEFNNALVAVRGGVDLLNDTVTEEDREILEMMSKSLDTATRTARSLLDFSRHAEPSSGKCDVREVIVEVAARLRPIVGPAIEIDVRAARGLVVGLEADIFEQVLLNLLLNSVDAMPDGGRIATTAETAGGRAIIEVRDEGEGMSPDVVARIFEPFFTSKVEDGTGLGLAVVYGHVTRAGGTVRAESVPGEGTTLTVDLPLVDVQTGESDDD